MSSLNPQIHGSRSACPNPSPSADGGHSRWGRRATSTSHAGLHHGLKENGPSALKTEGPLTIPILTANSVTVVGRPTAFRNSGRLRHFGWRALPLILGIRIALVAMLLLFPGALRIARGSGRLIRI